MTYIDSKKNVTPNENMSMRGGYSDTQIGPASMTGTVLHDSKIDIYYSVWALLDKNTEQKNIRGTVNNCTKNYRNHAKKIPTLQLGTTVYAKVLGHTWESSRHKHHQILQILEVQKSSTKRDHREE